MNLTISAAHASVATAALAGGKLVCNEKPIAALRDAAADLVDLADPAELLGTAPETSLDPGRQLARGIIERGDIGTPLTVACMFQTSGPRHWHPNPEFPCEAGRHHGTSRGGRADAVPTSRRIS